MDTIAEIIKSNRVSKKISIEEVSKELNIQSDIIKKIESNSYTNDSDIIFLIGHIRSYSNFLDLDSDRIIKIFKKQISFNKNDTIEKINKPIMHNQYLSLQKFFPMTLIFVIFISFYLLFINESQKSIDYALIPDLPESYEPIIEKANLNKNKDEIVKINNSLFNDEVSDFTSANASNNTNKSDKDLTVTLKILNSTWLQLRDESHNIIISQLMDKGEEFSYDMNLKYNITAGNAGNILVIVNKEVRGKIGDYGEVLDSFILDNSFKN